ncbi:hypothetical protein FE275_09925 [Pseudomonas koreensis]|nr:hypothetical protein FE275_09925 [Pseudomonas koreensis]
MWERACSRRRRIRQLMYRLTHRIREHARSHRFLISICNQHLTTRLDDKHYHSLEMDQVSP